jgi:hypothetical protein
LKHIEPAMKKACSEESTSWKDPNTNFTAISTTGNPARTPELHGVLDALFHCRNVFLGNDAADDGIGKFKSTARFLGLELP